MSGFHARCLALSFLFDYATATLPLFQTFSSLMPIFFFFSFTPLSLAAVFDVYAARYFFSPDAMPPFSLMISCYFRFPR
jgi:hypothetical protein